MITRIYEASIFSKSCEEIDFAATAQGVLPVALLAITLAGVVACYTPIVGVVVILTGLVITTAYIIFFTHLRAVDNDNLDDSSVHSLEEEDKSENVDLDAVSDTEYSTE